MKLFSLFRKSKVSVILPEPSPPPLGSTTCASCNNPIVPGEPVAHAWIGAPHPFTHATFKCDESGGGMYGGIWGNGNLVKHPSLV